MLFWCNLETERLGINFRVQKLEKVERRGRINSKVLNLETVIPEPKLNQAPTL
jgi:hypothetical protein